MYDWDSLYGEASSKAMSGGKKRFYDERVHDLTTVEEGGKSVVRSVVHGDREYRTEITFDEQGGLYDYACDCAGDKALDGPCRHIIATALAYESKFPSAPTREASETAMRSDASVRTLIENYGKLRRGRKSAFDGEKVSLVPIAEIDAGGRVTLKFTIGMRRQYVLKDVSDFVTCMQTGARKRYGVELTVTHVPEVFDTQSAALAAFVCAAFREKNEFLADLQAFNPDTRDRLRLSAGGVDEFMALYAGQFVSCDDALSGDVRMIAAEPNALPPALHLDKVSGGYLMTGEYGKFEVVHGKKCVYIVTDAKIYPVTPAYYDAVFPVVRALQTRGRLFVSGKDMSQFYNSVLCRVTEFTEVAAPGIDLSGFEAAPLELKMYVDALEGGGIEARVQASYDGETEVDIFDENAFVPYVRDYESEAAFLTLLRRYFPACPDLRLQDEGEIYTFLREGVPELTGIAELYMSDSLKKMRVKKPPRVRVGVRLHSDLLQLDLSAEEYTSEQLGKILEAYRTGRSYVRLTDGSFVDLLDPSVAALGDVAAVAEEKDGLLTMPSYYAAYVDGELKSGFFRLERSENFKRLVHELAAAGESLYEVPPALRPVLRNYQKEGFRWLETLTHMGFGGILADDMGLGKSLQIIALLLAERGGTSIIVCPTTLVLNWASELQKFAPELSVLVVTGRGDERKDMVGEFTGADVVLTSYELLRRDVALYEGTEFAFAVIDEAQYIKNPETKNARAVKQLHARHRFALTGTPVENSLAELWSIFDFLMPGYLFAYPKFRDTLEAQIVHGDDAAAAKLGRLVKPFMLRRLKSAVLQELPPKTETDVLCPLEGAQRAFYAANVALVRESVTAAGDKINKVVVLGMLTKLRQICCEPRLVQAEYDGNSAKLETCLELVRTATAAGHKVLVFSQFTTMLEVIRARLAAEGITHYLLRGDTPKVERVKLVSRFNEDDTKTFLISLKAGGTGLNLTGADVVILYDPWWNESVMMQATDRAYRIGQDKPVQVYKLIMQDSIEQQIMKLQAQKTALSDMVLGAGNMDYKDILKLLD